jgi:hypothetical protein
MNVLLVVNDTAALITSDTTLRTRLETTLGHTVTLANDHDAAPNLSGTQGVVFAPSCNVNALGTKYDNATCGVLALGNEPHTAMSTATYAANGGSQYDFDVAAPGDALVGSLTGNISILSSAPSENYTYYEDEGLSSDIVQVLVRGTRVCLARAKQGAILAGGVRNPTRRVFYTPNTGWPELFNADGWAIFDNAVAYIGVAPGLFPTASAGPDQEVEVGDVVQLDSSASNDPDGTIQSYSWRIVATSGPTITLSDPAAANPTFTAPNTACRIILGLTITDNHPDGLRSTEDTVRIDVVSHLMTRIAIGGVWVEKPLHSAKNNSWY